MRRLLAFLVLVPFAAVVVLSCDDHPTAPEEAQVVPTGQESSTPQATRVPSLPAPVVLAGIYYTESTITVQVGMTAGTTAYCPEGKVPLSGGVNCRDMLPTASAPFAQSDEGDIESGWKGWCRNDTSSPRLMDVSVICVDGSNAELNF